MVGTSVEWYDFFIFATASALVFGPVVLPHLLGLTLTMMGLSTFVMGLMPSYAAIGVGHRF